MPALVWAIDAANARIVAWAEQTGWPWALQKKLNSASVSAVKTRPASVSTIGHLVLKSPPLFLRECVSLRGGCLNHGLNLAQIGATHALRGWPLLVCPNLRSLLLHGVRLEVLLTGARVLLGGDPTRCKQTSQHPPKAKKQTTTIIGRVRNENATSGE